MNGAVIHCGSVLNVKSAVNEILIPKIAAQLVPPQRSMFTYREGALDIDRENLEVHARDFVKCSEIWHQSGLMHSHTSLEQLVFRNQFSKRIVSKYLDGRTGMSYGFFVRQLPFASIPAIRSDASDEHHDWDWATNPVKFADGKILASVRVNTIDWIVILPDISVLCTRSGCNKTNLDLSRDIVRLGLSDGKLVFDTPVGVTANDAQPSYDTVAILSHAIANAIIANILVAINPHAEFPSVCRHSGLSITHWHGYLGSENTPAEYFAHGESNPPVACSTPQSAVYALMGKLSVFENALNAGKPFRGDVHIEPHHGTNISGCMSLTETALYVEHLLGNLLPVGRTCDKA